jgi:hypothetical protein
VLGKDDDGLIEVRWIEGSKLGTKEKLPKSEFTEANIKWASISTLASFNGKWTGRSYQLKSAKWNEKYATILDKYEPHIDNIQHDIMCIKPRIASAKYNKSFCISTKLDDNAFRFEAAVKDDEIDINVNTITW